MILLEPTLWCVYGTGGPVAAPNKSEVKIWVQARMGLNPHTHPVFLSVRESGPQVRVIIGSSDPVNRRFRLTRRSASARSL
jgi:hypothetical protein